MKMKKASLATRHKFNIRKPVTMAQTYRLSIVTTEKILRSSMKTAGIADGDKIIQNNKSAVGDLTREIIETKLEVKSIRSLLEHRTSKFEGLTEYDQHFIKTFAREAAISFAEYFAQGKAKPDLKQTILHLSADADLYRDPKSKYCYHMGKELLRYRILKYLIGKTYQTTPDIRMATEAGSDYSVRSAIMKINAKAKNDLKIGKLIEGRRTDGYRINPEYRIFLR
ncbi:hypothetical protein KKC17_01935 [Patescibacteria group bacterium]|nr:hypothetical protein [Patescibacteria group bacterium]